MQYVFLSHDVDWRRQGAPKDHILNRAERFDENVIQNIDSKNPYYNLPQYMEIEESFGIRSTFFFRTKYENGSVIDYEDDLKSLVRGGWEIGLHCDPSSINDLQKIRQEKLMLENLSRTKIFGNRVHYLGFNVGLPKKLQTLGFLYDSTIKNSKQQLIKQDFGFFRFDELIEFPITLMDAYIFTYMNLNEDQILPIVQKALSQSRSLNLGFNIMTIIWHDNVLQMKGGRMYKKILEYLLQENDVKICSGMKLVDILKNSS